MPDQKEPDPILIALEDTLYYLEVEADRPEDRATRLIGLVKSAINTRQTENRVKQRT
ncbi:MAG: hypothetical protein ACM3JB_16185 [Acidobacteriaceae bacterium]